MSELSLSLLGVFSASVNGRSLTHFRAKTVQALLIYLVCQPEVHQREHLMTLLWPGMPQASAQQNLRQNLYLLRQAIPELLSKNGDGVVPFLLADRQTIQVNPNCRYHLDIHAFNQLLKQDESCWPEAVALYRGDFLADFYLPDSAPFEEWVNARRADLQRQMLRSLEKLTDLALMQAAFEMAETYARRQLEIDNLHESAQRQLMEALARNGRRVDALAEYETLIQRLQTELGVVPSSETQALYQAIQKNDLMTEAYSIPPSLTHPSSPSPRHNLPQSLTSFIGREKEIAQLQKLLLPTANHQNRLVTLTGAGGTGKTRLSLETARTLQGAFPDGIWLVELAPLANPALVPATVAAVFGLRGDGSQPLDIVIGNYLKAKKLLLILDNCEHLIETCARLAENWLENCPQLHILATSRELLAVPGEMVVPIPPLAVPDLHQPPPLEALAEVEAVQLFVERAGAVLPDFSLTLHNGPAVTQVCQRLDGIPLAIELAAARVKVLQVEQVCKRLDDRFHLLTGGSRTALPRHQTLHATVDWSYDLLSEAEQQLLQRLSVFAGGWTLDAAEGVCADDRVSNDEVLDLLTQLVNKSLVIAERAMGQETRYRLLETIRQYALERLAGDVETFRRRHLVFFCQLAETAAPELGHADQLLWLGRLETEHDNLRAALEYAFNARPINEVGYQITNALNEFWDQRSYFIEQLFWLEKALDQSCILKETPTRAKFLYQCGIILFTIRGSWEDGRTLLEESLKSFQALGEPYRVDYAHALVWLGFGFYYNDEPETGVRYLEEAIHIYKQAGDKRGYGWALNFFSDIKYHAGDIETANAMAKEGLALYQESGDRFGAAACLFDLGMYKVYQGHYSEGQQDLKEALDIYREFENKGFAYQVLQSLGDAARGLNEYGQAEHFYRESYAMCQDIGVNPGRLIGISLALGYTFLYQREVEQATSFFKEAWALSRQRNYRIPAIHCLAGLAAVLVVQGKVTAAVRLYGFFEFQIQSFLDEGYKINSLIDSVDRLEIERYQSICCAELDDVTFNKAWTEGQAMSLEEAMANALVETSEHLST